MPGGYAHITLAAKLLEKLGTIQGLTVEDRLALSNSKPFCQVGAVGPDYPYLAPLTSGAKEWADNMHYKETGNIIRHGVRRLRDQTVWQSTSQRAKAMAWLFGYASHVGMDLCVHPVVNFKVGGKYSDSTKHNHRKCEMNQDAFIWYYSNMGDIGDADYFRQAIHACSDEHDDLLPGIAGLWSFMMENALGAEFIASHPEINKWHHGYRELVEISSDGSKLFPFARHVLAQDAVLTYPARDDIEAEFIGSLKVPAPNGNNEGTCQVDDKPLPFRTMDYNEIFEFAVGKVANLWSILGNALNASSDGDAENALQGVPNGNLDTGTPISDTSETQFIFWA